MLNKAAKIVRKDLLVSDRFLMVMFEKNVKFVLSLNSLVKLISMILEGGEPSRECQLVSRESL